MSLNNQENYFIIDEFDSSINISKDHIQNFTQYFEKGQILINHNNIFSLHYLSDKYYVSKLKNQCEKYINDNYKTIIDELFQSNNIIMLNPIHEMLISIHLSEYFNDSRLYSLPINNLYRILQKYTNIQRQEEIESFTPIKNSTKLKISNKEENDIKIVDFLIGITKCQGVKASILFKSIKFNENMNEYLIKCLDSENNEIDLDSNIIKKQLFQYISIKSQKFQVKIEELQEQQMSLKINFDKEMKRHKKNEEKSKNDLEEKFIQNLKDLEIKTQNKLDKMKNNYDKKIEKMKKSQEKEYDEIEANIIDYLNEIKKKLKQQIDDLKVELKNMKEEHEQTICSMKETFFNKIKELKEQNSNQNVKMQNDIHRKINEEIRTENKKIENSMLITKQKNDEEIDNIRSDISKIKNTISDYIKDFNENALYEEANDADPNIFEEANVYWKSDASNIVLVKNVPFDATAKDIGDYFNQNFGDIKDVTVLREIYNDIHYSRGMAFIEFKDQKSFQNAISTPNIEFKIKGKSESYKLKVLKAKPNNEYDTIFVYDIPKNSKKDDIKNVFETIKPIKVRIVEFGTKRAAYAKFESPEDLNKAVFNYKQNVTINESLSDIFIARVSLDEHKRIRIPLNYRKSNKFSSKTDIDDDLGEKKLVFT